MKALKFADSQAMAGDRRRTGPLCKDLDQAPADHVKLDLCGEEVVHKKVTASGKCGRVYLPLGWVGKRVKIIRLD